jgi:hypothetical protein
VDTAVALVQAYLRLNGYFTVTEYPVFELGSGGGIRTATDLDLLAFRFPGAGRPVIGESGGATVYRPDPALGVPPEAPDMILGEVKEGRAELNGPARRPAVLAAALARFGCCSETGAARLARELVRHGRATTHHGHQVRLFAFGGTVDEGRATGYQRMSLSHVIAFVSGFVGDNWSVLRHGQSKDATLALFWLLQKCGPGARGIGGPPPRLIGPGTKSEGPGRRPSRRRATPPEDHSE